MRSVVLACVIFAVVIGLAVLGLMPMRTQIYEVPPRPARVETPGPKAVRVQVQTSPAKAEKAEPAAARKTGRESQNVKIPVVGAEQVSPADAQLDALVHAQVELETYLRTMTPPVYWKPPLEYIRTHLLKGAMTMTDVPFKLEKHRRFLESLGPDVQIDALKQASFEIEITPTVRRDLLYHARQERSWDRQLLLLPALGVTVLTLLAGAAYINLDERSKGYYTTWLRLTAGGAVAAALGLGLWWFAQ